MYKQLKQTHIRYSTRQIDAKKDGEIRKKYNQISLPIKIQKFPDSFASVATQVEPRTKKKKQNHFFFMRRAQTMVVIQKLYEKKKKVIAKDCRAEYHSPQFKMQSQSD